ncbi:MAG: S8 family serine peptidase [Planctomycetes bacterium]|nr:S8 family serine peptidase [Planctomycetota bacterium]MCB9919029.1 S8 family serine peptidase [Planctomycetota bacterium]
MEKRLTLAVSSLLLIAAFSGCAQTGQDPSSQTLDARSDQEGNGEDVRLPAPIDPRFAFAEVKGEKEFSGRMIVRPRQVKAAAIAPDEAASARAQRKEALEALAVYPLVEYVAQTDEYLIRVPPNSSEREVATKLMATGGFEYAEPDWTLYPVVTPNDTFFSAQWQHQNMQSEAAWNLHTGNPSVSVGICDTGVLTTHEDLQLHRLEGYNAVDQVWESNGGQIGPVHSHGTQTTGCAAANGNNGKGVAGVGWNLSHRMLRVSNVSTGSASMSVLQHAARTAVENGSKVASVSYSGADSSSNLTTATYIKSIGGLLIWAAGNDSRNLTFGNRDNDDLIVVGATDSADALSSFSAFGTFVDVVAPGTSVATTSSASDTSYVYTSGTSFSTPFTAGLCAMVWSANPSLTPNQVEAIVKGSCDDLGSTGVDNTFGYGRINLFKAVTQALGNNNNPPTAEFVGTPTSGTVPLSVQFTDQSTGSPTSWSWTFGDGGTSSAQNPSHTYSVAGTYTVAMTASNTNGSNTRTRINYIVVSSQQNQAPVVDAGPNRTVTLPASASLDGTVSDDGLPNPPGFVTTTWSVDSGPGTVTFGNASAIDTTASFSAAGTYVLRLSGNDGALTSSDTMQVVVNAGGGTEVQIAFDDIESGSGSGGTGWSDVWRGAGDVSLTTRNGANSGRWHIQMRASSYAQRQLDMTGVTSAKLIFWAKLRSFENGDTATVAVSTDGGATFTTLRTFVNGEDDNNYHRYEFPLNSTSATTVVRFQGNMSARSDYYFVDDVEIRGVR